jgi:DNA-binding GntR family transcriptional regulator
MTAKTDTTSAGERVYRGIMEKLFSGEIASGERLIERNLSKEFGVSRVPVREILAKLVAQGVLVDGEKSQGVRLREYSPAEVQELYEFREIIEGGAARAAASAAKDWELDAIKMLCDRMEEMVPEENLENWWALEGKFHQTMVESSHSKRFVYALNVLDVECQYLFFYNSNPAYDWDEVKQRRCNCIVEHRAIYEAIRDRNGELAEQKAREHMRESIKEISLERVSSYLGLGNPNNPDVKGVSENLLSVEAGA